MRFLSSMIKHVSGQVNVLCENDRYLNNEKARNYSYHPAKCVLCQKTRRIILRELRSRFLNSTVV